MAAFEARLSVVGGASWLLTNMGQLKVSCRVNNGAL